MIEARALSKRFHDKKRGEIRAVEGVTFRCQPGQIYGLLGANGAGKSTTLRMLATILEPSDGTDRKSTRLNSSHLVISYAVFCLKKKKKKKHYRRNLTRYSRR